LAIRRAVIPAAGLGTRLYPATKSQPKEMLPLGTKPTIQYVVEELVATGVQDILLITGRQKRAIEDHFDAGDAQSSEHQGPSNALAICDPAVHFFYVRQSSPRGLGDAIAHAEPFTGTEAFVVALGDCVILGRETDSLMSRMVSVHEERRAAATVAVQTVAPQDTTRYGIVAPEPGEGAHAMRLQGIVEKPGPDRAPSNLAVCARYVFSPAVFDHIRRTPPGLGGEVQLTDAIGGMIQAGLPVYAVALTAHEERLDVGNQEAYAQAFLRVALSDPQMGAGLRRYVAGLLVREDEK